MQLSAPPVRVRSLFNTISAALGDPSVAICLQDAGTIYHYPHTTATLALINGLRPFTYTVAIKTRPPSVSALLMHSSSSMGIILLDDSSVIPVVNNAACLVDARSHSAAILRDEQALVSWATSSSDAVWAQHRAWQCRINQTAAHLEYQMNSLVSSPSPPLPQRPLYSPGSLPSISYDCASSSPNLSSLPELEDLNSLDVYDTFFLGASGLTSPLSPTSTFSTGSSATTSLPDCSPFHVGVCLADISPAPPTFGTTELPDASTDDNPVCAPSPTSFLPTIAHEEPRHSPRAIKSLPSRAFLASKSPFPSLLSASLLSEPQKSAKATSSQPMKGASSNVTSTTPLFSSMRLGNSPPLGTKRKSPASRAVSPAGRLPALSEDAVKPRSTPEPLLATKASPPPPARGASDDFGSDLSDLDAEGEDEDEYQPSDDEFASGPPAKKSRAVDFTSIVDQSRSRSKPRRRRGKAAGKKKGKFYCEHCNDPFTRDADRKRHLKTACKNRPKDEGPIEFVQCSLCPSFFARGDALKRHRQSTHGRT